MSTITVVPTVEPFNSPPRVRLDVTDTGSSPAYTSATVLRLDPDGVQRTVRTNDGNPLPLSTSGSTRVGLVYDYEPPYGSLVSYSTLESPGTVSAEVTVDETRPWLIHPGVPELSMPISMRPGTLAEEVFPVRAGVFYPMGRKYPVVQTDGSRKGSQSSLVAMTESLDELDSLMVLLADAAVLLLNIPAGMNTGFPSSYIAVGDVKVTRWTSTVIDANRDVTIPFQVVDPPAGGTQAERTYADIVTGFATYANVQAAYSDYLALLAGP